MLKIKNKTLIHIIRNDKLTIETRLKTVYFDKFCFIIFFCFISSVIAKG